MNEKLIELIDQQIKVLEEIKKHLQETSVKQQDSTTPENPPPNPPH